MGFLVGLLFCCVGGVWLVSWWCGISEFCECHRVEGSILESIFAFEVGSYDFVGVLDGWAAEL